MAALEGTGRAKKQHTTPTTFFPGPAAGHPCLLCVCGCLKQNERRSSKEARKPSGLRSVLHPAKKSRLADSEERVD